MLNKTEPCQKFKLRSEYRGGPVVILALVWSNNASRVFLAKISHDNLYMKIRKEYLIQTLNFFVHIDFMVGMQAVRFMANQTLFTQ